VIRAWEVAVATEVTCATTVHVVTTSAQETAAAWERVTYLIQEVEAGASLGEREAWERVSILEVESAAALASAHREAEGFARSVALLEGELTDACQARDMTEASF
jgi:hypothetical protein